MTTLLVHSLRFMAIGSVRFQSPGRSDTYSAGYRSYSCNYLAAARGIQGFLTDSR